MPHFSMILRGLFLGIGAAAPIGPVNVEIARRTLQNGFRAGFALGCGAVTVDVTYAILASLSLKPAMAYPSVMFALGIFGAAFLIYLGVSCLRQAARIQTIDIAAVPKSFRNYFTGVLMTAPNPMTLAFWFLLVPAAISDPSKDHSRDLPLVCIGVFLATITWVLAFSGAISLVGGLGKQRWIRVTNLAGGILLLTFAGMAIWRVARANLSYPPLSLGK
jgi:L-lysine exporter family protein LysE/ArgO